MMGHTDRPVLMFQDDWYITIDTDNVPFPRFLLIDKPENLGIDEKNLISSLSLISELFIRGEIEKIEDAEQSEREKQIGEGKKMEPNFQIILTTGIGKYPDNYKEYVVETLTEENKLLKSSEQ